MTRREFLGAGIGVALAPLRLSVPPPRSLRLAVIADLHHGLAPDAADRLRAFVEATMERKGIDLAIQMGDFCYSQPDSAPALELWGRLKMPTVHVLGNHDMDKVDKETAMRTWGMKSRYGSFIVGPYRFVVLDLNHFKKDGKLVSYANGNYFTDNATHNWADPEQLDWLAAELRSSREPTIVLSHQPLGFAVPGKEMGPEQAQVLDVISGAARANPQGAVAACLCGHMHVDWLRVNDGMPCYCVNSASYFWYEGMQKYSKPLFAFMELSSNGELRVEGRHGEFAAQPPKASDDVVGRSASIASRRLALRPTRV